MLAWEVIIEDSRVLIETKILEETMGVDLHSVYFTMCVEHVLLWVDDEATGWFC